MHYNGLGYQVLPLFPTNKRRKDTEPDLLNRILQIKATTQILGPPQSMISLLGIKANVVLGLNISLLLLGLFQKSRQGNEI